MVQVNISGRGMGGLKPSRYQKVVFDWVKESDGSAVVEAVAGSGKTTTVVKALSNMQGRVHFCAFNRHIKTELARRVPGHVSVSTIHSMGLRTLSRKYGNVVVESGKLKTIVDELLEDEYSPGYALHSSVMALSRIVKVTLTDPNDRDALLALMDKYDIGEPYIDEEDIMDFVPDVLSTCAIRKSVIDYDDMVWLPTLLKIGTEQYDWVCVDEVQDLNAAQRSLVLSASRGRVLAVGDSKQSIYGFSGADLTSMSKFQEVLDATTFPLSICYRCPSSHLDLARKIVPHIEARKDAPEGVVAEMDFPEALDALKDGDLFICRVNAPLAEAAMALVRRNQKVTILGRDISKGLIRLIDRMRANSVEELFKKMEDYRVLEVSKLMAAKRETRAMSLIDKVETILALSDGAGTIDAIRNRIQSIFDDNPSEGVIFGSVHKVKGLEANRVFLYRPELIPHPRAKKPWEQAQEMNLKYVALTRSKETLVFVKASESSKSTPDSTAGGGDFVKGSR